MVSQSKLLCVYKMQCFLSRAQTKKEALTVSSHEENGYSHLLFVKIQEEILK